MNERCPRCAGRLSVIDGMRPTGHGPGCPYERGAKTIDEVRGILAGVKFMDRSFAVMEKGDGYLLQVQYTATDIDTGKMELQKARKWYVSMWSTETEIVETVFLAIQRSMYHVVREHFTYKDQRVFSPHFSIGARLEMAQLKRFDRRPDGRATRRRG